MEEREKPLTGEDAERQPTKPDIASPAYRTGADHMPPASFAGLRQRLRSGPPSR